MTTPEPLQAPGRTLHVVLSRRNAAVAGPSRYRPPAPETGATLDTLHTGYAGIRRFDGGIPSHSLHVTHTQGRS